MTTKLRAVHFIRLAVSNYSNTRIFWAFDRLSRHSIDATTGGRPPCVAEQTNEADDGLAALAWVRPRSMPPTRHVRADAVIEATCSLAHPQIHHSLAAA